MTGTLGQTVLVEPDETARRIRDYIRSTPGLRKSAYDVDDPHSLNGHCYVAAESYYHARGGRESGLDIYCLSWRDVDLEYGGTHWFLGDDETVIDLGLDVPRTLPWDVARRRSFITGHDSPSKRTKRVLDALGLPDSNGDTDHE